MTTIIYVAGKVQSTRCMVLKILTNEYVNIFQPLNMFSVAYITVLASLGQPKSCHVIANLNNEALPQTRCSSVQLFQVTL